MEHAQRTETARTREVGEVRERQRSLLYFGARLLAERDRGVCVSPVESVDLPSEEQLALEFTLRESAEETLGSGAEALIDRYRDALIGYRAYTVLNKVGTPFGIFHQAGEAAIEFKSPSSDVTTTDDEANRVRRFVGLALVADAVAGDGHPTPEVLLGS